MIKSFWEEIRKEKIRNNKGKMSTRRIYMSGSIRVHKCLRHPCMPEYGSKPQTLHLCVCICICEACESCLSMEYSIMKTVGIDFDVVWIFYSFNDIFISSYSFKVFWKLIGLLSNYHNIYFNQYKSSIVLCFYLMYSSWCARYMGMWVSMALEFVHVECD